MQFLRLVVFSQEMLHYMQNSQCLQYLKLLSRKALSPILFTNMDIKPQLQHIGLTDHEATIYTFLLEKGRATAQQIYTKTGVHRVTTYNVLENLTQKGLVSVMDTEKKRVFQPESPKKLIDLLNRKEEELERAHNILKNNKDRLSQFLPTLEVVYQSLGERPKMRFLEGLEGLQNIREDMIRIVKESKTPIYEIFSEEITKFIDTKIGLDLPSKDKVDKVMSEEKLPVNLIYTYKQEENKFPENFYTKQQDRNYVPYNEYPIDADIIVYGNKTIIISSLGNISSVMIENREVANTLRTLFRLAIERIKAMQEKK